MFSVFIFDGGLCPREDCFMKKFANVSNHNSENWGEAQKKAAIDIVDGMDGVSIVDFAFPAVSPTATTEDVNEMATAIAEDVIESECSAALVAGPFGLCLGIATRLAAAGIKVFDACSERNTSEVVLPDGSTKKVVTFSFVQFRRVL